MFQGYYMATSGMLTQGRNLNVISNNMSNVLTPGYRSDRMVQSTFKDHMVSRTGNKDKSHPAEIGKKAWITRAKETVTDYSIAGFKPTRSNLDFAINGKGFFKVKSAEGPVYTRNGSFILDNQGYLMMPNYGRVQGRNGDIHLGTDRFSVSSGGRIISSDNGRYLGSIQVFDFNNYKTELARTDGNVFVPKGNARLATTPVLNKALNNSNVDAAKEMTRMISSQRALQSSANVLKTYDTLMGKIVSQLGTV